MVGALLAAMNAIGMSCVPSIVVRAVRSSPPSFSMRAGVVFRVEPRVSRLRIYGRPFTPGSSATEGVVWEFEALGDPVRVGEVTYGEVPAGFRQVHPAESPPAPLQVGSIYSIMVWGPDGFGRDKFDWLGEPTYERAWLERWL